MAARGLKRSSSLERERKTLRKLKAGRRLLEAYARLVEGGGLVSAAMLSDFRPDTADVLILHALVAGHATPEAIARASFFHVSPSTVRARLSDPVHRAYYSSTLPLLIEKEIPLLCVDLIAQARSGDSRAMKTLLSFLIDAKALAADAAKSELLERLRRLSSQPAIQQPPPEE